MDLIELKNITKIYKVSGDNAIVGCNNISLNIAKGTMLGIMGPSGSGKSTLLHIIGALDTFDSGSYMLNGRELNALKPNALAELRNQCFGFVLQDFGLLLNASVQDNLEIPLALNPAVSQKEIKPRIRQALELVHMDGYEKRVVAQLSGGQKQRIAIARAMINQPEILLCDEPTGALDRKTTNEIMDMLCAIHAAGTTIMIVTHDIQVANRCEKVIQIVDGQIID